MPGHRPTKPPGTGATPPPPAPPTPPPPPRPASPAAGSGRPPRASSAAPAAPILSLAATDNKTVVIKLKEPVSSILAGLSSQLQGLYFVVPKEADGGIDLRRNPVGAGAYYLKEYVP